MLQPNFIILYVENVESSVTFYADVLARKPVEQSENFALFALDNGLLLGLWAKYTVAPAVHSTAGGFELAVTVATKAAVDSHYEHFLQRNIPILQTPTFLDFGYTCVIADPDAYRLRIFFPQERSS